MIYKLVTKLCERMLQYSIHKYILFSKKACTVLLEKTRGCVVIKVYGAASYFLATEGGIFLRRLISEVFPKIFDSQAVKSAI